MLQMTAGIVQFLHTLFLFPDVSERVFEEIQSVTQGHRLPTISDRPLLPFTDAVWKEAVRWRPFIPIGKLSRIIFEVLLIKPLLVFRCSSC
jgi:cytochrome P450